MSTLVQIPWQPQFWLRPEALALLQAASQVRGHNLVLYSDPAAAWRSYAQQKALYDNRKPGVPVSPPDKGPRPHMRGGAFDLRDTDAATQAACRAVGLVREPTEAWHWQHPATLSWPIIPTNTSAAGGGGTPITQPRRYQMIYNAISAGPAGSGILNGYKYLQGEDGVLRPIGALEAGALTARGDFVAQWQGAQIAQLAFSYGIMQVTWAGLEPMYSGAILRGNPLVAVGAATSALTSAQNTMLMTTLPTLVNDIPTNGEMGQVATSTVSLVNQHADVNKDAIIAAIDASPAAAAGPLTVHLTGDLTGSATPEG